MSDLSQAEALSPALRRYNALAFTSADLASDLRKKRHHVWCESAIDTLLQQKHPQDVCLRWSQAADEIAQATFASLDGEKLGLALFALGKWGAKELNLSSDIDYMLVAEEPNEKHSRFCRQFQSLISDVTPFGFCFRSDLDLRPGGRMGPLVSTPSQFQDYYGNHGETWERMALVRLRFICGSQPVKTEIESFSQKFLYRRHLDYTLLEDLKNLRSRIHSSRSQSDESIHLKLDVGGIRDIELFIHALLVIHGGKDPSVRTIATGEALDRLSARNLLKAEEAEFLKNFYWQLRQLENSVQAFDDMQTHSITEAVLKTLSSPITWSALQTQMKKVDDIVSSLLGAVEATMGFPENSDEQKKWLSEYGMGGENIFQYWQEILNLTALSQKRERDEKSRREFLGYFVQDLSEIAIDSELAFSHLRDFLNATRAKATFFTLLNREPQLRKKLAWLFSVSPYLSRILSERPELLDSYFYRQQDEYSTEWDTLLIELLEKRLLTELTVGSDFLTDRNLPHLLSSLSTCADEIAGEILKKLKTENPSTHLHLLPLGKWGGRELGFRSDLDFIFVTDEEPTPEDYKVARRVISRLTDPQKGGQLYSVDLRLRPSGNSGPLITSRQSLQNFVLSADAWIRQAYLRARILNATPFELHDLKGLSQEELSELKRIRRELLEGKETSPYDLKYSRGGLIDIEFTSQIAILEARIKSKGPSTEEQILSLMAQNELWQNRGLQVLECYRELRMYEQMQQLVGTSSGSDLSGDLKELAKLARIFRTTPDALKHRLVSLFELSRSLLADLDHTESF